jgi:hypothetical protein
MNDTSSVSSASPVDTKLSVGISGMTMRRRAAGSPSPVSVAVVATEQVVAVGGVGNDGVTGCMVSFLSCMSKAATPLSSKTPTTCAFHNCVSCNINRIIFPCDGA